MKWLQNTYTRRLNQEWIAQRLRMKSAPNVCQQIEDIGITMPHCRKNRKAGRKSIFFDCPPFYSNSIAYSEVPWRESKQK